MCRFGIVAGWWWAQRTHLWLGWRYFWCVHPDDRGRHLWGEVNSWGHPSRRWGLWQPHGQPLHPGIQAQTQEGHHRQQACSATPENSLWAGKAHLVFVHSGQHRDRLPVWGHRLLHKHHSCQVSARDMKFVRFYLQLGWFSPTWFPKAGGAVDVAWKMQVCMFMKWSVWVQPATHWTIGQ